MKSSHKLPTGKYYGTEVTIDLGNGDIVEFKVWKSDDPVPSKRQLEAWGFRSNYKGKIAGNNNYENESTFNICEEVCRRFNCE